MLQTDLLGLMAPTSSMWSRCSFTSSRRPEGIFLNLSLKGLGSVTLILCSATLVHPISPSSSMKILWYSASKFRAFFSFSSVQDLRPESSSFLKRTFLLSLTDSPACPSLVHLQVQRCLLYHQPPLSQELHWLQPFWLQQSLLTGQWDDL